MSTMSRRVGAFLILAWRTRDNWRPIGFALAAATFYGTTAALVKVVTTELRQGAQAALSTGASTPWPPARSPVSCSSRAP